MTQMQLAAAVYRNSVIFFLVFFALVLWGFWSSYYSNPFQIEGALMHLHGLAMTLWCLMLIAQAFLIRTNRRSLHRAIGKTSFVLMPLNVVLQIAVIRMRTPLIEDLWDQGMFLDSGYVFLSLSVVGAVLFIAFYGLALANRKTAVAHGGFMMCTAFPILAAGTDRIIFVYFPSVLERLPTAGGAPNAPIVAWVITDVTLIALSIWDWMSHRRLVSPDVVYEG
jgi:hypothetical protein